jgi:hypothetical protein
MWDSAAICNPSDAARATLVVEGEALGRGVVGHVTASGLAFEPFADIALPDPRLGSDLCRRGRHDLEERPVQTESVADHGADGLETPTEIGDEGAQQFVELVLVDGHLDRPLGWRE